MKRKNNKKAKVLKSRNWIAIAAHFRTGAGSHGNKKKARSKTACRGKIKYEV